MTRNSMDAPLGEVPDEAPTKAEYDSHEGMPPPIRATYKESDSDDDESDIYKPPARTIRPNLPDPKGKPLSIEEMTDEALESGK